MKNIIIIIISVFLFMSCKGKSKQAETEKYENTVVTTDSYELIKSRKSKALLIVFPAGGTTSKETKENFKIVKDATDKNISVLLMNFNRHLWIDKEETKNLIVELNEIIEKMI